MFDINEEISEWRKQMLAAGLKTPAPLDELENHLMQDFAALVAAGEPEDRAFQRAVSRLGSPALVRAEFGKIETADCAPVTAGWRVWLCTTVVVLAFLGWGLFGGKLGFVLFAHIFCFTAGYAAAFLTGGFGICYVFWRWSGRLSPMRRQLLGRAVAWFGQMSAVLVTVGLLLGMLWTWQHFGKFWTGGPRGIGCLCGAAWLGALWIVLRLRYASERATMLICIGGNVVVGLAWFGAGIVASHPATSGYPMLIYWPLAVFLAIHLCFLAMGIVPAAKTGEARSDSAN